MPHVARQWGSLGVLDPLQSAAGRSSQWHEAISMPDITTVQPRVRRTRRSVDRAAIARPCLRSPELVRRSPTGSDSSPPTSGDQNQQQAEDKHLVAFRPSTNLTPFPDPVGLREDSASANDSAAGHLMDLVQLVRRERSFALRWNGLDGCSDNHNLENALCDNIASGPDLGRVRHR